MASVHRNIATRIIALHMTAIPSLARAASRSCILVIGLVGAVGSFAQTASQITPRAFTPSTESQPKNPLTIGPSQDGQAPVGAENLFVRLANVELQGGQLIVEASLQAIIRKLTNPAGVSGAQIFAAARELERAYAAAGYVLERVAIPPQTLNDGGTLHLVLIDGYIERVEVNELPARVKNRIVALTGPLVGKRRLTLAELERRVLLASDVPGVVVRSSLAPGSVQGAVVLIMEAKERPIGIDVGVDNSLGPAFGNYSTSVGVSANGLLGLGEQAYVRAQGDPAASYFGRYPRNRILAAGALAPIGKDGLSLNTEGVEARTDPSDNQTPGLESTDRFRRLSLRLRYPWLRSRPLNIATELVFDAESEQAGATLDGVSTPLSLDRLRVFRFNADGDYLAPWGGVFLGRASYSQGIDGLGARSAADAAASNIPLSRQGSDADFSKLELAFGFSQQILEHLAVSFSAQGQDSLGNPLAQAEQIGLVGPTALSTFDAGTLQGDSGYVVRAEISAPERLPWVVRGNGLGAAPYFFAAEGKLWLNDPTSVEDRSVHAGSYGVGLRLGGAAQLWPNNGAITLEYGRQTRSDQQPIRDRFNVNASMNF